MLKTIRLLLCLCSFFATVTSSVSPQTTSPAPTKNAPSAVPAAAAPLRIGIAGLVHGHVGGFLSQNLKRTDIQIVGIAEKNQELSETIAAKYNLPAKIFFPTLEEMLNLTRPQAVLIYSNTFEHRAIVEACARRGIPVMMEKPLAVSLDDARAMQDAAQRAKIPILVNYETTWYRSNRAAYDLVHQNAIGEIRKVVIHDGHQGPKEINVEPWFLAWLTDPKLNGGGALFDFGCYGADLMTWLMDGRRPDSVTAVTQHIKPEIYPHVDDEATIVLTYTKAQAILQASWNWPYSRKDMEIYGQNGYAITVARDSVRARLASVSEEKLLESKPLEPSEADSVSYLRAVVVDGTQPQGLSSLETNVIVTEILDAARQSAASGKTIRLEKKE